VHLGVLDGAPPALEAFAQLRRGPGGVQVLRRPMVVRVCKGGNKK
jgi:hypothetical protein